MQGPAWQLPWSRLPRTGNRRVRRVASPPPLAIRRVALRDTRALIGRGARISIFHCLSVVAEHTDNFDPHVGCKVWRPLLELLEAPQPPVVVGVAQLLLLAPHHLQAHEVRGQGIRLAGDQLVHQRFLAAPIPEIYRDVVVHVPHACHEEDLDVVFSRRC